MTATTEPTAIRAGDSVSWKRTVEGCPASAGWVVSYRLVPRVAGVAITIPTAANGDDHAVIVPRATSAAWAAGEYTLFGVAINATDRVNIYSAPCSILPDLMASSGFDSRSTAAQIVASIDEYFRTRDRGVLEKQLGDRRLKFQTDAELLATRNYYARQIVSEAAAANIANGLGVSPTRVQVRM